MPTKIQAAAKAAQTAGYKPKSGTFHIPVYNKFPRLEITADGATFLHNSTKKVTLASDGVVDTTQTRVVIQKLAHKQTDDDGNPVVSKGLDDTVAILRKLI